MQMPLPNVERSLVKWRKGSKMANSTLDTVKGPFNKYVTMEGREGVTKSVTNRFRMGEGNQNLSVT